MPSIDNHPDLWRELLPQVSAESHKYNRGLVMVGASHSMPGASILVARAAQRLGAGIVKLASPVGMAQAYRTSLISAITHAYSNHQEFCKICEDKRISAFVVGSGGDNDNLKQQILSLLSQQKPIVLDAGGLDVFANDFDNLQKHAHSKLVLTPHNAEFQRLFADIDMNRLGRETATQQACALVPQATLIVKGAETIIAQHNQSLIINRHASPYLATAGSGDVLAGMLAALLSGGMPTRLASAAAVWIHAQAGLKLGAGLIAEDLPQAARQIWQNLIQ